MKTKSILIAALALAAAAAPALAQDDFDRTAHTAASPAGGDIAAEAKQDYWGVGFGYVFNKVPISMSTFDVFMANLWYSRIFGDPNEDIRMAGTLGLYGFQVLLPVPRASLDLYVGKPTQTLQFKGGIGGFYDVAVGGHGGISGELGVVVKNRVDISFLAVPLGTDSKRSYAEFMGIKSEAEAMEDYRKAGNRWVEMPYYGIFVGLRF
jgi:hypothetical protein